MDGGTCYGAIETYNFVFEKEQNRTASVGELRNRDFNVSIEWR